MGIGAVLLFVLQTEDYCKGAVKLPPGNFTPCRKRMCAQSHAVQRTERTGGARVYNEVHSRAGRGRSKVSRIGVGKLSIKGRACRERQGRLKGVISRQVVFDYVDPGKNQAGQA